MYEQQHLGFNYTDIQAAIGVVGCAGEIVAERNIAVEISGTAVGCLLNFLIFLRMYLAQSIWRLSDCNGLPEKHKQVFEGLRAAGIGVQMHTALCICSLTTEHWGSRKGNSQKLSLMLKRNKLACLPRSSGNRSKRVVVRLRLSSGMSYPSQLTLGTFSSGPYGVTNQAGQVPEEEVVRILNLAAVSGISLLDTARAYGTAELVWVVAGQQVHRSV